MNILLTVTMLLLAADVEGQRMVHTVYPTADPPVIDGRLDDTGWSEALAIPRLVKFGQSEPADSPTTIKLVYDDEAIYVAFACMGQDPNSYIARAGSSGMWMSDHVELFFRTRLDKAIYGHLGLRIDGAKVVEYKPDQFKPLAGEFADQWQTAIQTVPRGWTAEVRVPYATLGDIEAPRPGQSWLANFCRQNFASGEMGTWGREMSWFHDQHAWGRIVFGGSDWPRIVLQDKGTATFGTNTAVFKVRNLREQETIRLMTQTAVSEGEGVVRRVERSVQVAEGEGVVPYEIATTGRTMVTVEASMGLTPLVRYVFPMHVRDPSAARDQINGALASARAMVDEDVQTLHWVGRAIQQIESSSEEAAELVKLMTDAQGPGTDKYRAAEQRLEVLTRESFELANLLATRANARVDAHVPDYYVTAHHTIDRLPADEPYNQPAANVARIEAARDEWESVQIPVVPVSQDLQTVVFTVSDLVHEKTGDVFPADRIRLQILGYPRGAGLIPGTRPGRKPGPILDKDRFSVDRGGLRSALLTVWPPRDAKAGVYRGKVTVAPANAHATELAVEVRVFGFTMPARMTMHTAFFAWGNAPPGSPFAQMLCDYRIPPLMGGLPFDCRGWKPQDITNRLRFCLDRGLNAFALVPADHNNGPYDEGTIAWLKDVCDHLRNEGLLDLAYIYVTDEPSLSDPQRLATIRQRCEQLHALAPDLRTMVTCGSDERLFGYVDIWCPQGWDTQKALARTEAGDEVWSYVCGGGNRPNFNYDNPGIDQRILMWENWKTHATGFLYWAILAGWEQGTGGKSAQEHEANDYADWVPSMSDGLLAFPGSEGRVYASMRILNIRDGIEDYEYFHQLDVAVRALEASQQARSHRGLIDETRALLVIEDAILTTRRVYTQEPMMLLERRHAIGEALGRVLWIIDNSIETF